MEYKNKTILENGSIIRESIIDDTSVCYNNTIITKSKINQYTTIGDGTTVFNSILVGCNSINRYNCISDSTIDFGTYTGHRCTIKNTRIGKFCSLSWDISLGGKNHNYNSCTTYPKYHMNRVLEGKSDIIRQDMKDTEIGNDVWIGSGAIILRGVNVGDGAVIGAGAVVNKDVEPYSIVVGNPARMLKKRFSEDVIDELLKMRWWDWSIDKIREKRELLEKELTMDVIKELWK